MRAFGEWVGSMAVGTVGTVETVESVESSVGTVESGAERVRHRSGLGGS